MKRLEDISEYYTPERALAEEIAWIMNPDLHKSDLGFLLPRISRYEIKSMVEFGCGSGFLALGLPKHIPYIGFDRNAWFLDKARMRNGVENPLRTFRCFDVRNVEAGMHDLALCWSFLKHFSLEEWPKILAKVLSAGKYAAFNLQLAEKSFDDGTAYHHTFVTEAELKAAIAAAGHEEIEREKTGDWIAPDGTAFTTASIWTKRKEQKEEEKPQETVEKEVPVWQITRMEADLEVDGVARDDLHRYSLRWHNEGDCRVPSLYQDGKRLIVPWRLKCDLSSPGGGDVSG